MHFEENTLHGKRTLGDISIILIFQMAHQLLLAKNINLIRDETEYISLRLR